MRVIIASHDHELGRAVGEAFDSLMPNVVVAYADRVNQFQGTVERINPDAIIATGLLRLSPHEAVVAFPEASRMARRRNIGFINLCDGHDGRGQAVHKEPEDVVILFRRLTLQPTAVR